VSLSPDAEQALQSFAGCSNWEQRARLLLNWGAKLPALEEQQRTDKQLVNGCESKVWLVGEQVGGHWQFRANSDARLISGLLAVLLSRVNGLSADELRELDLSDWFNQLGLARNLSPSRSNGLNAVLQHMRQLAAG